MIIYKIKDELHGYMGKPYYITGVERADIVSNMGLIYYVNAISMYMDARYVYKISYCTKFNPFMGIPNDTQVAALARYFSGYTYEILPYAPMYARWFK